MIRIIRPHATSTRALFLGVLIAGAFLLGLFQSTPAPIPIHAAAKANGNGWECKAGYLEVGADCMAKLFGPNIQHEPDPKVAERRRGVVQSREEEIKGLRQEIESLSLENAVLRSAIDDDR